MTSADEPTLIEQARNLAPYDGLVASLADALEASEAARRDLTDKIETLAERWDRKARTGDCSGVNCGGCTLGRCTHELRGLVSGDKKEAQ